MVYVESSGDQHWVVVEARGLSFTSPNLSLSQAAKLAATLHKELDPWLAVIRLTQLRIYSVCNS